MTVARFLLDTNVIGAFAKRGEPDPTVKTWLLGIDAADLAISVLTITEMVAGVERKRREDAKVAQEMAPRVRSLLTQFQGLFLPVGAGEAELLGEMHACPPLRNFITGGTGDRPKNGADLLIAATAIVNNLVVVTRDVGDFAFIHQHFPLPGLFNPFEGEWVVTPAPTVPGRAPAI